MDPAYNIPQPEGGDLDASILRAVLRRAAGSALVWAGVIFLLFVLVLLQMGDRYKTRLLREKQAHVATRLASYGNILTKSVSRRFAILDGLAAFTLHELNERGMVSGQSFEFYAKGLTNTVPGINGLSLAPDAVQKFVYPLAGNEAIIGANLLDGARPEVQLDIERAISQGRTTLSGPYLNRAGDALVLAARRPVYWRDEFWGLATINLDIPALMAEAGLNPPPDGLVVALRSPDRQAFYGPPEVFDQDPALIVLELPEGSWELAAAPAGGWQRLMVAQLVVARTSGFTIVILFSVLVFLAISRQISLTASVAETTLELHESQRLLHEAEVNGRVGSWAFDLQKNEFRLSEVGRELYGLDTARGLLPELEAAILPEDLSAARQALSEAVAGGSYEATYRVRTHSSSEVRWLQARGQAVYNGRADPVRVVGSAQDVTQLKKAAAEIQRRASYAEALNTVIANTVRATDLVNLLKTTLDGLIAELRMDGGVVWMPAQPGDEEQACLVIRGLPPESRQIGPLVYNLAPATDGPLYAADWSETAKRRPELQPLADLMAALGLRAAIIAPLISAGKQLGGFCLAARRPRRWEWEEIALVATVGVQISAAAQRLQLEQALAQSEERYRIVSELTSDWAACLLLKPDGSAIPEWTTGAFARITGYPESTLRMTGGLFRILHPDDQEYFLDQRRAVIKQGGLHSEYRIICQDGEVRWLRDFTRVEYDSDHQPTRFYVAGTDITERKQRELELESLVAVTAALRAAHTRAEMLAALLDQTLVMLGAAGAAVLERDPTGATCVALACGDLQLETGMRLPAGAAAWPQVWESGQPYWPQDGPDEPAFELGIAPGRSVVCVPLLVEDRVIGALWSERASAFRAADIHLQTAIADIAANALQRETLHEQAQRFARELGQAYESTLEGWAHALELRDRETEGHAQRVTRLTLRLGRALGFQENELAHIRRGVLLHDIGKMGIPDSILLKTGALTEEEWMVMRLHPQYAYEMMAPIDYLRPALDIPYCHHEHWDGSGYPRGLKEEQIPLPARLFAVVDVWDALSSDRPYRKAWPQERVLAYLQSQAGKQFDPQAVALFLENLDCREKPGGG